MRGHNGHHLEDRDRERQTKKYINAAPTEKKKTHTTGMELLVSNQSNKNCTVQQKHEKHHLSVSSGNHTCVYLFAAAPADSRSVLNTSPQLVSLLEEVWKPLPPALSERPWKNLVLALLLILLHGVGKITSDERTSQI